MPKRSAKAGRSYAVMLLVRCERRRPHSLDAARVEIFGTSLVHEVDDDPINTTGVVQSIHAMAGFRDEDVAAVW